MILEMVAEELLISSMAVNISFIRILPLAAVAWADWDSSLAWPELSAFSLV